MEGWGIRVVTITPSYHRTEMGGNGGATVQAAYEQLDEPTKAEYGEEFLKKALKLGERNHAKCWDPQNAVNALIQATTAVNPRSQYVVGSDAIYSLVPLMVWPIPIMEEAVRRSAALQNLVPAREKAARAQLQQQQQGSKQD